MTEHETPEALIDAVKSLNKEINKSREGRRNRTLDPIPDDEPSGGRRGRQKKVRTNTHRGSGQVYPGTK